VFYYVEQSGVFAVPLDGSAGAAQVSPAPVPGGLVHSFDVSSDSQRVVYRAEQDTDGVPELYASDLGGTDNVKLNAPLLPGRVVESDFVVQ